MTDIIERLRVGPHLPVRQLRAFVCEVAPLAIAEIETLRRQRAPAPDEPATKPRNRHGDAS